MNADELTIDVRVNFERYEWKVLFILTARELERALNEYSAEGWNIFNVLPGFHVVLQRQLETEKASGDSDD